MTCAPDLSRMPPQALAELGVPVEVALRARIKHYDAVSDDDGTSMHEWFADCASLAAYRDALAIIEAQGASALGELVHRDLFPWRLFDEALRDRVVLNRTLARERAVVDELAHAIKETLYGNYAAVSRIDPQPLAAALRRYEEARRE